MQPQPGEEQHDESDGEAEDEPRAEVDHLGVGVAPGTTHLGYIPLTSSHHNNLQKNQPHHRQFMF